MTTRTYSTPFYRSAVDGLVVSADNNRSNLINRRQIFSCPYPIMTTPSRTSYIPQSYPIHSNILRSSTGSVLHRVPNPRTLPTTILHPTNVRWDSAINIVDFRTRPLINPRKPFLKPILLPGENKLLRSATLQPFNPYLMNNRIIQKPKLDAKHFCGLEPIQENKLMIREIPSFRPSETMSR